MYYFMRLYGQWGSISNQGGWSGLISRWAGGIAAPSGTPPTTVKVPWHIFFGRTN